MPRKGKYANKSITNGILYADTTNHQLYGTIKKPLGNCHFSVINALTDEEFVASLCGNVKKGGRIAIGDFVLFEPLTDNEAGKYKIIYKYTPKEKKILEKEGRLKVIKEKEPEEQTVQEAFVFEGEEEEEENMELELDEKFIDDI